jgi:nucleoside permease NupC
MIATYALCGFSNPASIGITIASLSAMAPERRPDIAGVVLRAFIAGFICNSSLTVQMIPKKLYFVK